MNPKIVWILLQNGEIAGVWMNETLAKAQKREIIKREMLSPECFRIQEWAIGTMTRVD